MDSTKLKKRIYEQIEEVQQIRDARRVVGDQLDVDWLNGHLRAYKRVLGWLEDRD